MSEIGEYNDDHIVFEDDIYFPSVFWIHNIKLSSLNTYIYFIYDAFLIVYQLH